MEPQPQPTANQSTELFPATITTSSTNEVRPVVGPTEEGNKRRDKFYERQPPASKLPQPLRPAPAAVPTPAEVQQNRINARVLAMGEQYTQVQQVYRPPITLDYGRELLGWIMRQELAKRGRTLINNPVDEEVTDKLLRYSLGDPTGPLDIYRSIFLWGPPGAGKTFLFYCLNKLIESTELRHPFGIESTKGILAEISEKKDFAIIERYQTKAWLLDDLMEEKTEAVKVYGDNRDPLVDLLSDRYWLFIREGIPTHFTSNHPPSKLGEFYGPRISDRAEEWTQFVKYNVPSKRPVTYVNQLATPKTK